MASTKRAVVGRSSASRFSPDWSSPAPTPVEAAPAANVAALPGGLAVNRMILTRGIANKEPIDDAVRFAASDGEIYTFASFRNPGRPTEITFIWYHDNRLVDTTRLTIGKAPSWRTWSKSRVLPGAWRVEITDPSGTLLAKAAFTVE